MPLYEYECDVCGHRFEVIRKFSDPPIDRCPACGASVHKLQSAPAFQFKGTGWYITDYARKGGPPGKSESAPKEEPAKAANKDASPAAGDSSSTSAAAPASPTKD